MKVLHVIPGLGQGGAERQLASLVSFFPEDSVVFSLKTPGPIADEISNSGVPLFSGDVKTKISPRWTWNLQNVVGNEQPDLIMGWMYHGNLAAAFTKTFDYSRPVLWNVRHSVQDITCENLGIRWAIKVGGWASPLPDKIIYNSEVAALQHERLGYPQHKRAVLPNGFNLERYRPDPALRVKRRLEFGVSDDEFLLGVIGRSHPMKNHLGWVEAMRCLVQCGLPVHCIMVGSGVSDENGMVARAVQNAGLTNSITLLPSTKAPAALYPGLDLLVLPSLWGEGFPNVVGEAMACGVPALVTDVGDSARVVGEAGFVAPAGDVESLVVGVRGALEFGHHGLSSLGEAARDRIAKNFSLKAVAHSYHQLWSSQLPHLSG